MKELIQELFHRRLPYNEENTQQHSVLCQVHPPPPLPGLQLFHMRVKMCQTIFCVFWLFTNLLNLFKNIKFQNDGYTNRNQINSPPSMS